MFSIPYFFVLINIYPSIVTIIHRILTYFRRNISLKHMFFKELRNISNKKSKSPCNICASHPTPQCRGITTAFFSRNAIPILMTDFTPALQKVSHTLVHFGKKEWHRNRSSDACTFSCFILRR